MKWHTHTIVDTKSTEILQKQDKRNIYEIMKTMCPPRCYHNGFVLCGNSHALGHMMYGSSRSTVHHDRTSSCAQVHELPQSVYIMKCEWLKNQSIRWSCNLFRLLQMWTNVSFSRFIWRHIFKTCLTSCENRSGTGLIRLKVSDVSFKS